MTKRRCAYCGRREEDVVPIQRFGGGNWRRPGRWYSSSISITCAQSIFAAYTHGSSYAGATISRYPVTRLREIAARAMDGNTPTKRSEP